MNFREKAATALVRVDRVRKSGEPYGDTDIALIEKALQEAYEKGLRDAAGIIAGQQNHAFAQVDVWSSSQYEQDYKDMKYRADNMDGGNMASISIRQLRRLIYEIEAFKDARKAIESKLKEVKE